MRPLVFAAALPLLVACSSGGPPQAPARAALRVEGGQFSVLPSPGQLPFCLVIEARGSEVVVPLPLSEDGQSVPCEAGKPIGAKTWPLPHRDLGLKAFVVFSDRPLKGDSIAQQIRDRLDEGPHARVGPMDLRAPGQVALEELAIPTSPSP